MKVIFPVMGAENISVAYLSTILKKAGHTVQVAFDRALFDDKQYFSVSWLARIFSEKERMIRAIIQAKPDILAMSVFADNYQWCLEVAAQVKKIHPCLTVFGGIHTTTCPEEVILKGQVDFVIVGEGDEALPELLRALETKAPVRDIRNLWLKEDGKVVRNGPRPLLPPSAFPEVDKTVYEKFIPMRDYYLTVTSKGCIAFCSYCSQNFLKNWEKEQQIGPFLREKSVDQVLEELKTMKARYGVRYIDIKNNVLSGNRQWLAEFLERYPQEVGVPFRIMGHPLMFRDRDLAARLKKAGCSHVQIGIESFNPDVREKKLLRHESNAQIVQALDAMEAAGINFSADLIIGLPGETENDLILALKSLVRYRRLIRASIFWLQYLPKVEITKMALREGYISGEDERIINEGKQNNYLSTGSAMESQRKRILKTYHIMFRLLPILPERVLSFLLDRQWHRIFRFIPFQILLIIMVDVWVSFVRNDYYAKWIMGWYLKQINRHLRGKVECLSR